MDIPSEKHYPFRAKIPEEGIYRRGEFSRIIELENTEDFIIKELGEASQKVEGITLQDYLAGRVSPPKTGFEWARSVKAHIDKINASQSGLKQFIPRNELIYGHDPSGKKRCFIIMEKVLGMDFRDIEVPTEEQLKEMGRLINESLNFYYESKELSAKSGSGILWEAYFPDILQTYYTGEASFRNIKAGRTRRDKEERLYIVDNYPLLRVYGNRQEVGMLYALKSALKSFDNYHVFKPWWRNNSSRVVKDIDDKDFWRWVDQFIGLTELKYNENRDNGQIGENLLLNLHEYYFYDNMWGNTARLEWIPIRQSLYGRIDKSISQVASENK